MKTGSLLTLCFILSAGLAQAGSRSSTNYSIVADSVDTGGAQVTSVNYSNSGSVGGITGLSTVASPSETVKSGYAGQLYYVTGLALAPTFVANGVTQQLAATQTLDDSTNLVLSGGNENWSVTLGQLPAGLTLNTSSGVISAQPSGSGSYTFTIMVTDGLGDSAQQIFSGSVIAKIPFSQWEAQPGFFSTAQQNDPTISGPAIVFERDGVPNLFKYLYNINPAQPMKVADRLALPVFDITPATGDLRLTYRQYTLGTGITINVQTSPDLKTWTIVNEAATPTAGFYTLQQTGTDPNTGDPHIEIDYKPASALPRQFIRLNVTMP